MPLPINAGSFDEAIAQARMVNNNYCWGKVLEKTDEITDTYKEGGEIYEAE